jgi:hypothetical protein
VFNQRKLTVADLDRPSAYPLHVISDLVLTKGSPALAADLRGRGPELSPLQLVHQI